MAPKALSALCALLCAAPLFAAPDPVTVLRCGRLLNPVDGSMAGNTMVLMRGDRVERVGPGASVPAGAQVVDLSAYTCLPGLIDSHTHVLLQPEDERGAPPVVTKSQAFRTIQGVAAAKKDLEAGFTTMRDVDRDLPPPNSSCARRRSAGAARRRCRG